MLFNTLVGFMHDAIQLILKIIQQDLLVAFTVPRFNLIAAPLTKLPNLYPVTTDVILNCMTYNKEQLKGLQCFDHIKKTTKSQSIFGRPNTGQIN